MMTTKQTQIDQTKLREILDKTMPYVTDLINQFQNDLGGTLPQELSYGMVAGFLRGKGFPWDESLIAMNKYIQVIETHYQHASKSFDGKMTISSDENGTKFGFQHTSE